MTAAYLDKYFECVEFMPLELQRCVSQLREVDVHTKGLYEKVEGLRCDLVKAVQEGNVPQQKICFRRLQESMLEAREAGNTKLEISSQLLDIAEGCGQLLDLRSKDAENHKNEDFHHNSRYSNPTGNYRSKTESPSLFLPNGGHEPKPAKRSSSNKRPRQTATASVDKSVEDVVQEKASSKEGGRGRENSVGSVSSVGTNGGSLNQSSNSVSGGGGGGGGGGGAGGGKPPKKKIKTVKKKAVTTKEKEAPPTITSTGQVPMPRPDLTSQPLDPDEPTYCLCQQVSFGEMIGCDNEDCPIEWFHFQCVKLTSKPKGKWYCPRCTQERKRTSK